MSHIGWPAFIPDDSLDLYYIRDDPAYDVEVLCDECVARVVRLGGLPPQRDEGPIADEYYGSGCYRCAHEGRIAEGLT